MSENIFVTQKALSIIEQKEFLFSYTKKSPFGRVHSKLCLPPPEKVALSV